MNQTPDSLSLDLPKKVNEEVTLLFVSFDLARSTKFKKFYGNSQRWVKPFRRFYDFASSKVLDINISSEKKFRIWKLIGDEIVFTLVVENKNEVGEAVDAVYKVMKDLHSQFWDPPDDDPFDIKLDVKSAAWIAKIDDKWNYYIPSEMLLASELDPEIVQKIKRFDTNDYMGSSIDEGFRVASMCSRAGRLALSFEVSDCLVGTDKEQFVRHIGYKKLKGVWHDHHYPVVWYTPDLIADDKEIDYDDFLDKSSFLDFELKDEDESLRMPNVDIMKNIAVTLNLDRSEDLF